MMNDLSIKKIRKIDFLGLYEKLVTEVEMTSKELEKILTIAIVMINSNDLHVKQLGYRIIVFFSNQYKNYIPLYEIAINQGLYPISHFIEAHLISEDKKNFFTELNESYSQLFKKNEIYQSQAQYELSEFYTNHIDSSLSVVAPTSYGKTELILDTIRMNASKKICIITPTKSLLAQTRKRILSAKIEGLNKVVVHPEMFDENDTSCVSVLTQERLIRLLKIAPSYSFDYVIIDEAHEIFDSGNRNELLASAIILLNKRNPHTSFKFLSPFINDKNNLKIRYTSYNLDAYTINEYIKTEKIYVYDIRNHSGLHFYDQFLNKWYDCPINSLSDIDFLLNRSGNKNIIYFNKPSDIEKFAKRIISELPDIEISTELTKAIKHISEYVNPQYTLVKCLKKGVIYHHGSIPDGIRQYIENIYCAIKEIRFVITSSTLLEGVNLPADKMFLFDNRKGQGNLSPSDFRNLIGRVCRFSEIFRNSNTTLKGLEPEIYIVFGEYFKKNANYKLYVPNCMNIEKKLVDKCENVLLKETIETQENLTNLKLAKEFIENYENGTINDYSERNTRTDIGKLCILNNIHEFDIFDKEIILQDKTDELKRNQAIISDSNQLIEEFNNIFVQLIDNKDEHNLIRFKYEATRNYYTMLLNYRLENNSFAQMVKMTVNYWESLIQNHRDRIVYVGRWGDLTRNNGYNKYWTDISEKTKSEKINLAIVRIKEEQDFIDNVIMKFVETFHDIELIDENLYNKIKYGTDNPLQIVLIKNGISSSLSKLLIEKYFNFINIDITSNIVTISPDIINEMNNNNENDILVFEAKNNIF